MTLATYQGNCHCGKNRFEMTVPEIQTVDSCNCDICRKIGYLTITVPSARFEMKRGFGALADFASVSGSHKFCSSCGTGLLVRHGRIKGESDFTVNVRSLAGVNPFSLDVLQPPHSSYVIKRSLPEYLDDSSETLTRGNESETTYTGRCLCGLVSLTVETLPLSCVEVKEDNCSICVRNAFIGLYPSKDVVTIRGGENTQDYTFGRRFNGHPFCKVCGTHLFVNLYGPPKEIVQRWPPAKQEFVKKMLNVRPVNARTFDDVQVAELDIVRSDEGADGYVLEE